jgi:hypothetical protein
MYQGRFLCLILLFPTLPLFSQGLVTPGFTSPASVCAQVPLTVQNTTVGGTNYFWSFCAAVMRFKIKMEEPQ